MKDQYSLLAPWYSSLVKLLFGEKLKEPKLCHLENTTAKRVLIVGGGDGLDYAEFAADISGEYWELSESMLKKARQNLASGQLDFHLGDFKAGKKFDEVWLHFVLDTMTDSAIELLLEEIKQTLKPDGRIVFADFFHSKRNRQKILNRLMISSFRLIVNHQRKNLPAYEGFFSRTGFAKTAEQPFMDGWVKAQVWQPE